MQIQTCSHGYGERFYCNAGDRKCIPVQWVVKFMSVISVNVER